MNPRARLVPPLLFAAAAALAAGCASKAPPPAAPPVDPAPAAEAVAPAPPPAPAKALLRMRLEKGRSYTTDMTMDQVITQDLGGAEQVIDQTIGMGMVYLAEDVRDDGRQTVRITYDRVRFRQKSPAGEIDWDSQRDLESPPPPAAAGFAGLVGAGFQADFSSLGVVGDVRGTDALLAGALSKIAIPEGPEGDVLREQLKAQFGEEAMKEMLQNSAPAYPDEPVGPGDTWTRRMTLTRPMGMVIDGKYTLLERANGTTVVAVECTVAPNSAAPPMEIGSMRMRFALSGTQSGRMSLDDATGWTTSATMDQDLKGAVQVEMEGAGEPMSIPMTIKGRMSYGLRK